jgi:hypothetical protein
MARAAMEDLDGIEAMMMSGTRATLVLAEGANLTGAQVKKSLEARGLIFESFEKHVIPRASRAYVAKTPKFT